MRGPDRPTAIKCKCVWIQSISDELQ